MVRTDDTHYLEKEASFKSAMDPSRQPLASYTPSDSIYSDADPLGDSSVNIHFGEDQEFITGEGLKFYWVTCYYRRRREFMLWCLMALLLILCITLSVHLGLVCPNHLADTKLNGSVIDVMCEHPTCFEYAALTSKMYDKSTAPCENMYKYACGQYQKNFPNMPDDFRVDAQTLVWKRNELTLRNIFETALPNSYNATYESAVDKIKLIFQTCLMNNQMSIRSGGQPILDIISKLGGWKVLGTWDETTWNFGTTYRKMAIEYFIPVFYVFHNVDTTDQGETLLTITPTSTAFYPDSADLQRDYKIQRHRWFITEVATMLVNEYYDGLKNTSQPAEVKTIVENFVDEIIAMDSLISKASKEFPGKSHTMKKISLDELSNLGPELAWSSFIPQLLKRSKIKGDQKLFLADINSIPVVSSTLQLVNNSMKHNYLIWTVIRHFLAHVSGDYRQPLLQLRQEIVGVKEYLPDWELCMTYLSDTPLNEIMLAMLIQDRIQDIDINQITQININIRDMLIKQLGWMKESFQREVKDKISKTTVTIGYTELITNSTKLDNYFRSLKVSEIHFKNVLNLHSFYRDKLEEAWTLQEIFPLSISNEDHYSPRDNSIILAVDYLQFPFYDKHLPLFSNYAGLGWMLARIYTFIIYDIIEQKRYNLSEVLQGFDECISEMFVGVVIEGFAHGDYYSISTDGVRHYYMDYFALELKTTFEAYQRHILENKSDLKVYGLGGATFEQNFFLSLSQLMCESEDPIYRKSRASQGIIPIDIRLDTILRYFKGFQQAFNCPHPARTLDDKKCGLLNF